MEPPSASTKPAPAAVPLPVLPPIEHGGRMAAARRLFPGAPEPFIDLSTGINAVPYPPPFMAHDMVNRLPEDDALLALQAAAAEAYGVPDPALVVAGPGTQILINLLPMLRPAAQVAVLGPTYAEHAVAWRQAGHSVTETGDLRALDDAEVAVVVNPNNPDGRLLSVPTLVGLAARLAARGGLLVVDEAFIDFMPPAVSVARLVARPGLVVLRSFGKTYGLAGLRLGFLLAETALAERLRRALGPWAVSGPAIAAGRAALPDSTWRAEAAYRLRYEGMRLHVLLGQGGLTPVGGTLLFCLADSPRAPEIYQRLGRAGLLVRQFPERPTLLRFGIPHGEGVWQRLAAALV